MLKGGKNKSEAPDNSPDKLNRIVEGTHIKGDVKTDSNIRFDGSLNGTLNTSGKLVIGVTGKVEGEISCANADIEGEVVGNLRVEGLLALKSTARVTGNIFAGKISIENGAAFDGNCDMGSAPKTTPKNTVTAKETQKESESAMVY